MSSSQRRSEPEEPRLSALALELYERHQQSWSGGLDRASGAALVVGWLISAAVVLLWSGGPLALSGAILGVGAALAAPQVVLATGHPGHGAAPWALGLGLLGWLGAARALELIPGPWGVAAAACALIWVSLYRQPGPVLALALAWAGASLALEWRFGAGASWWWPAAISALPALAALGAAWLSNQDARRAARRQARERLQQDAARSFLAEREASRSQGAQVADLNQALHPPMNAILDYADQLSQRDLAQDAREAHVRAIQRHGHNLMHLLNNMADLSALESEAAAPAAEPVSPVEVTEAVAALISPQAREKGVAFEVDFLSALPERFESDAQRLQQLLSHLLGHALRATHKGRVGLSVLYQQDGAQPQLTFQVTDTGIGLSSSALARLHNGHARAHETGLSLDLIISQRLAEHLGAELEIESDLGRGTRASVHFHTAPGARLLPPPSLVAPPVSVPSPPPRPASPLRVLLGEPSREHQLLIAAHLRHEGAQATMVDNGQHVVEEALAAQDRGEPYDVILMTMKMPEMDGYEATARLRHKGYRRPILALIKDPREEARCRKVGCDAHLLRPIEREPLLLAIQEHTRRKLASLAQKPAPAPEAVAPWAHQHEPAVELTPEPPTVELPVVHLGGASLSRWAQDPEMQPLLRLFVQQLPERLGELEEAAGSREALRGVAHRLKGSAGSYGFEELARLAGELSARAQAQAPQAAQEASLEALRAEVRRITWVPAPADGEASWSQSP